MTAAITTVIPTYRRPALLRRAVRSVLRQTYDNCIAAVIDNASGDETSTVVAELAAEDPRVRYTCQPKNVGGLANFAAGMAQVDTPYFSLLSDDDVLFPEFFETALAAFAACPQALMFAGSTLEFDAAGNLGYVPLAYWPREGVYQPDESLLLMLDNHHPTWTGIVFQRAALEIAGTLDPEVGAAADFDYEMRVAARAPIVVSFKPCAAWISHAASVSGGETAAVVAGYAKAAANISAVAGLDPHIKQLVAERLRRQSQRKLLEVSVKAQVRGDLIASRESATLLRDEYGGRVLGNVLIAMSRLCTALPPAQSLLVWVESVRVKLRAATARRKSARTIPDLERYAKYLNG